MKCDLVEISAEEAKLRKAHDKLKVGKDYEAIKSECL
jgi:hypothetical protein